MTINNLTIKNFIYILVVFGCQKNEPFPNLTFFYLPNLILLWYTDKRINNYVSYSKETNNIFAAINSFALQFEQTKGTKCSYFFMSQRAICDAASN